MNCSHIRQMSVRSFPFRAGNIVVGGRIGKHNPLFVAGVGSTTKFTSLGDFLLFESFIE